MSAPHKVLRTTAMLNPEVEANRERIILEGVFATDAQHFGRYELSTNAALGLAQALTTAAWEARGVTARQQQYQQYLKTGRGKIKL